MFTFSLWLPGTFGFWLLGSLFMKEVLRKKIAFKLIDENRRL
jgi:hypothetical protein